MSTSRAAVGCSIPTAAWSWTSRLGRALDRLDDNELVAALDELCRCFEVEPDPLARRRMAVLLRLTHRDV